MKRFTESRVVAATVAVVWAAAAGQLGYTAVQRALVESRIAEAGSFDEVRRVCAKDAENAECAARLAVAAESYGVHRLEYWDRAVELNGHDAGLLIQAALAYESAGDKAKAERLLTRAAERSRTWLPRWSLANYYYRRGRPEEVAKWARLALERGYGDRVPLYGLCRSAGLSQDEILNRVVGKSDIAAMEAYLRYARQFGEEGAGPLARAAEMLLDARGGAGLTRVSANEIALASEAIVRAGDPTRAYSIWQRLKHQGGLGALAGVDGGVLGDAGFTGRAMAAPGFGWAMAAVEGVEIRAGSPPGMVKIETTGGQPERLTVLSQRVRLDGGGRWVLRFEASANGEQPADGHFVWALEKEGEDGEAAKRELKLGQDWTAAGEGWDVEGGFWQLSLIHRRPLGAVRWSGELRIRNLSLRREGAGR